MPSQPPLEPDMEPRYDADEPIHTKQQDNLNRAKFAHQLARVIRNRQGQASFVIALTGAWGSGKSSIKNMVLEELQSGDPKSAPHILTFDPWMWSNQEQLTQVFFDQLADLLIDDDVASQPTRQNRARTKQETDRKARAARLKDYAGRLKIGGAGIKGLAALSAVTGYPGMSVFLVGTADRVQQMADAATGGAEAMAAEADAPKPKLTELRAQLNKDFTALMRPVLVVIDDIERLTATEVATVFQLIKANANFPSFVYLLLYERSRVEQALDKVVAGGQSGTGRDYLEKIVQVSFDVPLIAGDFIAGFLSREVRRVLEDHITYFEEERWNSLISNGLAIYFENMRDVRRFVNGLTFQVEMFKESGGLLAVNPVDLVGLEVLRVFEPEVYQALPQQVDLLTGTRLDFIVTAEEDRAVRAPLLTLVDLASESKRAALRYILLTLFPTVSWAFKKAVPSNKQRPFEPYTLRISTGIATLEALGTRRVCHPGYFNRYFQLVLPPDDFSRAQVNQLLAATENRTALTSVLKEHTAQGRITTALAHLLAHVDQINDANVLPVVETMMDLDEIGVESEWLRTGQGALDLATDLAESMLRRLPLHERGDRFEKARATAQGLYVVIDLGLVETARQREVRSQYHLFTPQDTQRIVAGCLEGVRKAAATGKLLSHSRAAFILYWWRERTGGSEIAAWIREVMQTDDKVLQLLPILFRTVMNSEGQEERTVERSHVARYIPAEELVTRLWAVNQDELSDEQRKMVEEFKRDLTSGSGNGIAVDDSAMDANNEIDDAESNDARLSDLNYRDGYEPHDEIIAE